MLVVAAFVACELGAPLALAVHLVPEASVSSTPTQTRPSPTLKSQMQIANYGSALLMVCVVDIRFPWDSVAGCTSSLRGFIRAGDGCGIWTVNAATPTLEPRLFPDLVSVTGVISRTPYCETRPWAAWVQIGGGTAIVAAFSVSSSNPDTGAIAQVPDESSQQDGQPSDVAVPDQVAPTSKMGSPRLDRGPGRNPQPRLLFVYPLDATFIDTDLQLLRRLYDVTAFNFGQSKISGYIGLTVAILRADIVFCWFALPFAAFANVLARLLGKKTVTVAGGFDVSRVPEIDYGMLRKRRFVASARIALATANIVLAVSEYIKAMVACVSPESNVRRAYLGVDTSKFKPGHKGRLVVCTAHVKADNLERKGLREFVTTARSIPDAHFVLVGRHWDHSIEELRGLAGRNVSFPGWLPEDDLTDLLARCKVYVQHSFTEGFGVALAEAMASGCVPVVTRVGAIPEVVGDLGYYVVYGDTRGLARAIREAFDSNLSERVRERIEERFSLDQRLQLLQATISELWSKQRLSARWRIAGKGRGRRTTKVVHSVQLLTNSDWGEKP